MTRLPWILDTAARAGSVDREWLIIGIFVLLLVLRHGVIAFLSRSEKRR